MRDRSDHRVLAGRINAGPGRRYRLQVIGGAPEPLYVPPQGHVPARIHYTRDHTRSLLHELAHWCLAGARRRRLLDYGYWYEAPPRNAVAQARFFRAERDVQALEQLFSETCRVPFEVSMDDFGEQDAAAGFARAVAAQARRLQRALATDASGVASAAGLPGLHARTRAVLAVLR